MLCTGMRIKLKEYYSKRGRENTRYEIAKRSGFIGPMIGTLFPFRESKDSEMDPR